MGDPRFGIVEGVEPYRGYTLTFYGDEPRKGLYQNLAVLDPWGGWDDIDVSRWNFHPTNDRFRWLVDNAFPDRGTIGCLGPLTDQFIDAQIALAN